MRMVTFWLQAVEGMVTMTTCWTSSYDHSDDSAPSTLTDSGIYSPRNFT